MLASPWIAALVALFTWWFSTGAILWSVRRAENQGRRGEGVICTFPILAAGLWGVFATRADPGLEAAYLAFFSAIVVWGWIEYAFLTGAITGPNRSPCPAHVKGMQRFMRAWGTIAHHENLLAAAMATIFWMTWEGANQVALWTFAVLFFARISAQLNLYLGVPKVNLEFLPDALSHLPSHFRSARLNAVFPVSITLITAAVAFWVVRLVDTGEIGFALIAALTALALLEHWLMVLPLADAKLWRWMLPAPKPKPEDRPGSGKTWTLTASSTNS